MPKRADLVFAIEPISQLLADGLEDLTIFHWQEVDHFQDKFPLKVNYLAYQMAERLGEFRGVSARRGRRLVGYAGYFVRPDLQHSATWAVNNVLYLDPDERKGWDGLKLMTAARDLLKPLGVDVIIQAVKTPHSTDVKRHARMAALMKRAGYVPYENLFALVL